MKVIEYLKLEEAASDQNKYVIRLNDIDLTPFDFSEMDSISIVCARLMRLDYPSYLRFCRDVLEAEIVGKNQLYPYIYFKNNITVRQFVKLLNNRLNLIKAEIENPLDKYIEAGLLL